MKQNILFKIHLDEGLKVPKFIIIPKFTLRIQTNYNNIVVF